MRVSFLVALMFSWLLGGAITGCGSDSGKTRVDGGNPDASDDDGGDSHDGGEGDAQVSSDAEVPPMDATPDAPLTDCHGSRSCASLSGFQCTVAGCEPEGGGTCEGTPAACNTYDNPFSCNVFGCNWNAGNCTGTPDDCADFDVGLCGTFAAPEGCEPSGACSGTADPCSGYENEFFCNNQPGCEWM